ncbi:MAG: C1 family peptidase [Bryobacterales bacterium]|nr:C1 family peptidase [Bryobacterales bacterium]
MFSYRCDYDDDFFGNDPDQEDPDDEGYDEEDEDGGEEYDDGSEEGDDGDGDDGLTPYSPDAAEEDFEEDEGDWSAEDYEASAERLFGHNEFFGETIHDQLAAEGFRFFDDPGFHDAVDRIAPGASDTLRLFERDGQLHAFGFVPAALALILRQRYGALDFSNLHISVPRKGDIAEPQPLPPEIERVEARAAIDLRPYATPVGDQADTARCSAFAWTHAVEMTRNLEGRPAPRLSPTYTMLQFQRLQGDAEDYRYAHEGGNGTISGPDPGNVLVEHGTCRQELWPDDEEGPRASERMLAADAQQYRLQAQPHPIGLEDVKKVLSAGCAVQIGMNTGPAFADVGRDGVISAAEPPSGRHGRHAMLLAGYNGNFYIAKNSWGEQWGDKGYCYIPKNVLAAADAEFIAVLRPVK